jgi:hypothetical protein
MNGELTAGDFSRPGPGRVGPPPLRPAARRDVLVFFVALPLLFALWAAAIGIGPARVLGLRDGFIYVVTQIGAAWLGNALACLAAAQLLRRWRAPVWLNVSVGYALGWLPLYWFYLEHFAFFSGLHPEIVPVVARPAPGLTGDYLLHATRFSLPFLPMWFAAVYGYRYLTGVLFFRGDRPAVAPGAVEARVVGGSSGAAPAPIAAAAPAAPARLPFLAESRLPGDAVVVALEAEEHYVKVWSDRGTDLVRYRFRDAVRELDGLDGAQVHRSWWINWGWVTGASARGRAMSLALRNGLVVPVSLAHKAEAGRRARAATSAGRSARPA